MSYNNNVPQVSQSLGQTQADINTNFNLIQSTISTNHFAISALNAGKHTFAEFVNQSQKPATAVSESTIYGAASPSLSNLFFRPENQLVNAGNTYQLTRDIPAQIAQFGTNPGWTFLPGNLIMMYGTTVFAANPSGGAITFPFSFTNVFSINFTSLQGGARSMIVSSLIGASPYTGFNFIFGTNAISGYSIYWTAIGN